MRRLSLVLAAVLVAGGAVAARASAAACPPGVAETPGENPAPADIAALLDDAATRWDIPAAVLKAIAYQESGWKQFDGGKVVVSSDAVCGLGIMQVTADGRPDAARLAAETAYNVDEGARILDEKWRAAQSATNPDDRDVVENWLLPICRYNGCPGNDLTPYAIPVVQKVADPFRRVAAAYWPFMRPAGFSLPTEADPAYTFPAPFQAQYSPVQRFVFYDANGAVTKTVDFRTHHESAPPVVSYGVRTYGPDGPGVTCEIACGGWRLAEGLGASGRAHWTLTGSTVGTRVRWAPSLPRTGTYRVSAYVPADARTLGTATYALAGTTAAVDQEAREGTWASLGDRTLSPGATVTLDDVAATTGLPVYADALRFATVTRLDVTASATTIAYGAATTLTLKLTHAGTTTGLSGKALTLYKRRAGTTAWTYAGTYTTGSTGAVAVAQKPGSNAEYYATYTPATVDATAAASGVRRVNVRPVVNAALSRTSVPRGTSVTVTTSVAPSHAGQGVYLQRYYSGAWKNVLSRTLNSSSAASFAFALSTPGTYSFRVYKPADADHVAAYSAVLTLKVT